VKVIKRRRAYGEHLTPIRLFREFIFPEIRGHIHDYVWVDLFAGEGNLILPILESVAPNERIEFFRRHIFLFDIQEEMVEKAIRKAEEYGIPREIAVRNISRRDTLKDYPDFLLELELPVYHITNPPYLYIGYIVKHEETRKYLEYFRGGNEGYQDLYQLALMNDLRHGLRRMIYIIPSNFLFGFSASNKIRMDFLKYYTIRKAVIFEREVFEHTGTNVAICFFERKETPKHAPLSFEGIKISKTVRKRVYTLEPKRYYRAGSLFEEFTDEYRAKNPLKVRYYLTLEEVERNGGNFAVDVIDANRFNGKGYERRVIHVNGRLFRRIRSNELFVRTVDTGSMDGRVGLYRIRDVFGVDGILVSKAKYRTHPIHLFVEPALPHEEQMLLKDYFNLILEYFREETDSEFMTTYKYSNSEYTRKYLGLSQVKRLIQTFPWLDLTEEEREHLKSLIENKDARGVIDFVKRKNGRRRSDLWR